jgi:predicted RNA-binding protein with PUA-like domain
MNFWLIKSEPFKYSWNQMTKDKVTFWDGVRSYPARVHLRAMKKGDYCLFYHSNEGKEIVGIVKVVKEAYQDPTTDGDWSAVDVEVVQKMEKPVTLKDIKANPVLSEMALIKQSRLSVGPVKDFEFTELLKMGETEIKG